MSACNCCTKPPDVSVVLQLATFSDWTGHGSFPDEGTNIPNDLFFDSPQLGGAIVGTNIPTPDPTDRDTWPDLVGDGAGGAALMSASYAQGWRGSDSVNEYFNPGAPDYYGPSTTVRTLRTFWTLLFDHPATSFLRVEWDKCYYLIPSAGEFDPQPTLPNEDDPDHVEHQSWTWAPKNNPSGPLAPGDWALKDQWAPNNDYCPLFLLSPPGAMTYVFLRNFKFSIFPNRFPSYPTAT